MTTHDTPGEIGDPRAATPRELQRMLEFERRGAPFLAYRNGNGDLELLDLAERTRVIVGREPPAQVLINWDLQVSRLHCVLAQVGAQWTVEDDGLSRNGTYLNGSRIAQRAILRAGDHLRVGRTAIQFQAPVTGAVSSTEVASDIVSAAELTPTQHQVLVALCRPLFGDRSTPATNPEIAAEVFLGVDAVKVHMRALFRKFDLEDLAQNEKRGRLAERAMRLGLVAERDL